MAIATIGIDLGKNSCSLAGLDAAGAVVLRRRLPRASSWRSSLGCRRAWWGWRPVAERIIWGGSSARRVTRCG
jgi:hypothetical protein